MMLPIFLLPISFIQREPNWILLSISVLIGAMFFPLVAILSGWSSTFAKAAIVLTYRRITRSSNAPLALEATA
jgi:hypothetical protein